MSTLTADAVNAIFLDCLFTEEETAGGPPAGMVLVEGVVNRYGLHPVRLESHRAEVTELLNELPEEFQEAKGGGWSFLQACVTQRGDQWGEHVHIEQLFVMAMGLGLGRWVMPRSMWRAFPGSMPYFVILNPKKP
jgi:hypothetical protein